jgi:hypothetical protein
MTSIQIKVTVPKQILSVEKVMREIRHTMSTKTAREIRDLFEKTTEGWSDTMNPSSGFGEVRWNTQTKFGALKNSVKVFTNSEKYALVNEGAKRHPITPRHGGMLRFRTGYRAATSPRVIGSRSPMRSGKVVGAQAVSHPGFEGRKFDETIAEEYTPIFEKDIQEAINRGSK